MELDVQGGEEDLGGDGGGKTVTRIYSMKKNYKEKRAMQNSFWISLAGTHMTIPRCQGCGVN